MCLLHQRPPYFSFFLLKHICNNVQVTSKLRLLLNESELSWQIYWRLNEDYLKNV